LDDIIISSPFARGKLGRDETTVAPLTNYIITASRII